MKATRLVLGSLLLAGSVFLSACTSQETNPLWPRFGWPAGRPQPTQTASPTNAEPVPTTAEPVLMDEAPTGNQLHTIMSTDRRFESEHGGDLLASFETGSPLQADFQLKDYTSSTLSGSFVCRGAGGIKVTMVIGDEQFGSFYSSGCDENSPFSAGKHIPEELAGKPAHAILELDAQVKEFSAFIEQIPDPEQIP